MTDPYPELSPIATGLRCRCPRCGRGLLFSGVLTLVEQCAVCDLAIAKNDNGDGPAVFLIFILGFAVVPLALKVAASVEWPLWLHGIVWGILILSLTIGMLRPAKGLVLAVQYRHRRDAFEPPPSDVFPDNRPENRPDSRNDGAA